MRPRWRATNCGVRGGDEHSETAADRWEGHTKPSLTGGRETKNTHQLRRERKTANKKSRSIEKRTRTYELGGGATRGGTDHAGIASACKTATATRVSTGRGANGGGGTIGDRASNRNTSRRWPPATMPMAAAKTGGGAVGAVERRDGRASGVVDASGEGGDSGVADDAPPPASGATGGRRPGSDEPPVSLATRQRPRTSSPRDAAAARVYARAFDLGGRRRASIAGAQAVTVSAAAAAAAAEESVAAAAATATTAVAAVAAEAAGVHAEVAAEWGGGNVLAAVGRVPPGHPRRGGGAVAEDAVACHRGGGAAGGARRVGQRQLAGAVCRRATTAAATVGQPARRGRGGR